MGTRDVGHEDTMSEAWDTGVGHGTQSEAWEIGSGA